MSQDQDPRGVDLAREQIGLSREELYLRYFALGGLTEHRTMEAFLDGTGRPLGRVDYDMLIHALNDSFSELGRNHPIPYSTSP